jgi:hypothetical protein
VAQLDEHLVLVGAVDAAVESEADDKDAPVDDEPGARFTNV